ncbi:MAG TPA: dienelactone hydrolase family protein [Streptosporangiaceae bacterium]
MQTTDIEYSFDGIRLVGELSVDDSRRGKRPAILVSHEGGGLTGHARNRARALAELGYVAFALDYFGDGRPVPADQAAARFAELNGDRLRTRAIAQAGLDVLLGSEHADSARVAAIGYCFGGTLSLELARGGAGLQAVVGFHSGLATDRPAAAGRITAPVLVCIGAEDPFIPADQRLAFEEEMRGAGADWRLNLYGGAVHSFTNPDAAGSNPALKYDRRADERSWRAMLDLFGEVF